MAAFFFHGDLSALLRRKWRRENPVILHINRAASIKDVIESCGLPHTEIGRIERQGSEVDFSFPVADSHRFDIHPLKAPCDLTRPTLLNPRPIDSVRFLVDANVGRLARYLRMAGVDTFYDRALDDQGIVELLERDRRILLTRDMGLLKRKTVAHGRYVRAEDPAEQLREILAFYGLTKQVKPFTLCLGCNAPLHFIDKEKVRSRLEPLTERYYHTFSICPVCDKLYWSGSHIEHMRRAFPELEKNLMD